MPNPANYETEGEFMEACVPMVEDEGMEQDQAVAVCSSMWEDYMHKEKASKNPGDFLVVEDREKVSTYHLQVKRDGVPDHNLMGAAWAALHGGYRGNMYEGPDKQAAIDKLRKLYESEDMELPSSKARGEGQGMGGEPQGDGGADVCVCPVCGMESPHEKGTPCTEQECPECGAAMAGKALEFSMLLTKAEKMSDGRTRWQARANTGQWDLEHERFDVTFWDDVIANFARVQESTSKGEDCGMPCPILDIAHYSFRLPPEKRNMARAGYPIKLWKDGQALMAQGYFDDTPLGQAAAKAATSRPVAERRVSVGVWPDWGRVELTDDGRRVYRGGRGRAYLDHLAMTAHPVDPGTVLEVKAMTEQMKKDALDVLGEDAEELVGELEAATTKSMPDGALVKAEEAGSGESVDEPDDGDAGEPEQKAADEVEPEPEPQPEPVTMEQLRGALETLFATFGEQISERLAPMEAAVEEVAQLKAQVDALSATETEKVQAAIDSGGDWLEQLVKRSVQRQEPVKDQQEPAEKADLDDPFYTVFPGLKPQE